MGFDLPEGFQDRRTHRIGTPFPKSYVESHHDDLERQVGFNLPEGFQDRRTHRIGTPYPPNSNRRAVSLNLPSGYQDRRTHRIGTPYPPNRGRSEENTVGFELPQGF